ncbi:MAG: PstS family phosphate ABC transporter substrate-binding protein [Candidatus Omnitrophota bacterium]
MIKRTAKAFVTGIICLSVGFSAVAQDMVQIKGSDTLVNLVQRLAEVYMEKNPGKYLAVTGGGSGTGIAAIMNNTCDIANASRDIKPKEIMSAQKKGIEPVRTVVGLDCITVVVNQANKVDKLTVSQLGAIFRGEVSNWKDVGGEDMPITLYGRQSNSGTFSFFMDAVLKGDYSDRMNRMNGNSQIVEAIRSDKTGIGYIGLGHAKNARELSVVRLAVREGEPYADPMDPQDVSSGKYPIIRTLNQYTNGKPSGTARDFMKFELSAQGQKIVDEMGFIPVPEEYVEYNSRNAGV